MPLMEREQHTTSETERKCVCACEIVCVSFQQTSRGFHLHQVRKITHTIFYTRRQIFWVKKSSFHIKLAHRHNRACGIPIECLVKLGDNNSDNNIIHYQVQPSIPYYILVQVFCLYLLGKGALVQWQHIVFPQSRIGVSLPGVIYIFLGNWLSVPSTLLYMFRVEDVLFLYWDYSLSGSNGFISQ